MFVRLARQGSDTLNSYSPHIGSDLFGTGRKHGEPSAKLSIFRINQRDHIFEKSFETREGRHRGRVLSYDREERARLKNIETAVQYVEPTSYFADWIRFQSIRNQSIVDGIDQPEKFDVGLR